MVKAPKEITHPQLAGQIDALLGLVDQAASVLVVSHIHPDGDAAGSTLATGLWLEAMGKDVVMYNEHPVPYNLAFLSGSEKWVTEIEQGASFDLTIMLDCAQRHRIGEGFPAQGWGTKVAVVDHHKTWDDDFASVYVRDPGAAATGLLLWHVIQASRVELSLAMAQCLYACLMMDTGGFRYSSTSPEVFEVAASLLRLGVSPWEMTSHLYESQPFERLTLLGDVLSTIRRSPCGRLALLRIEGKMLADDTSMELTDGFINYARGVQGVEVATQLVEIGEQKWRVSFRSRGRVDVSKLAQRFGGGGHHNAAGCTIEGSVREVEESLIAQLEALLDNEAL